MAVETLTPRTARPRRASSASPRRQEVLGAALAVLNERGAGAQMIDEIACRRGLDRASIYYYAGSGEELIFAAYLHSYERLDEHLRTARRETGGATSILERLIHEIFRDPTPTASLSAVGMLSSDHRAAIDARRDAFWRELTGLIEEGVRQGELWAAAPPLAARALEGCLMLGTLATRPRHASRIEERAAEVTDLLLHGRLPPGAPFQADYARSRAAAPAALAALWSEATCGDEKREAMLRVATRLINERGVNGMTLDDIVSALGVTKGAFYHYFEGKDDLIFRCYIRSQEMTERYMAQVTDEGGTGLERLQRASFHNFTLQLSDAGPLTLFTGYGSLPEAMHRAVRSRAIVESAAMREMAYRGIEDGSTRAYPVRVGQPLFGGASAWVLTWWTPATGLSVENVADAFIPFYTSGLKRRPGPARA